MIRSSRIVEDENTYNHILLNQEERATIPYCRIFKTLVFLFVHVFAEKSGALIHVT